MVIRERTAARYDMGARRQPRDTERSVLLAERLTSQLLAGRPAKDPVAVAERLLAIQGQDPRGARLAVRARSRGLSASDVDRALTDDRSLVIDWLNRGTLHLVSSEDYFWLHALMTPPPHDALSPYRVGDLVMGGLAIVAALLVR